MKKYFTAIKYLQTTLLAISLVLLSTLPLLIAFFPDTLLPHATLLYHIAHAAVFLVMLVRPLADIVPKTRLIRPLVILRKGMGVFSASIVTSFILAKIVTDPSGYPSSMFTAAYWSLEKYALLAHVADISAILLLITSNNFSKRVLGTWWKRVQRLSYVYFFASASYVYLSYGTLSVVFYMYIVAFVTILAFIVNSLRRYKTNAAQL